METPPITPEKPGKRPTTEELRGQRQALETRIADAQRRKEQFLSQKVQERNTLVAERTRLGEQLQEAEETLKFYEQQHEGGLLDEEGAAELETLRTLVSDLRSTSGEIMEKYDEIMANPDVFGKVYDEAYKEKQGIDLEERKTKLQEELTRMGDAFIEQTRLENQKLDEADKAAREKLTIRDEAMEKADGFASPYGWEVERYKASSYSEVIDKVKEKRKKVGLFDFKAKSRLDNILNQESLFLDADRKSQEFETAKEQFDSLLQEAGKTLYEEKWRLRNYEEEKIKELEAEFPSQHVSHFFYGYLDLRDKGVNHASRALARYEDEQMAIQRRAQASQNPRP